MTEKEKRFITLKELFDGEELLDEKLSDFATLRNYSTGSKCQFAKAMMHYCNSTKLMPAQLLEEAYEDEDNIKRINHRRINGKLAKFKKSISHLAPNTEKNMFNAIIHWYAMNDIQIPAAVRSNDKVTGLKENRFIPTADDIREALNYVTYRDKAIILLQCSSGMGTSELLSITRQEFLDGINYDTMITTLHPVRKKTQTPYTTFCSPEATNAVLFWLKEWDGEMLIDLREDGVTAMYQRINKATGKEKGVYGKFRSHNMRKFFNNELLNAGMSYNLVWFLSGRSENSTQKAYYDWKEERLREEYIKFVKHISVTEVVVNLTPEDVMSELNDLKTSMSNMQKERDALARMVQEQANAIKDIQNKTLYIEKLKASNIDDERKEILIQVAEEQKKRKMGLPYKKMWEPE